MTVRARQFKEILNDAFEVPEPERATYLGEVCGADEGLRREIESFLELRSEAGDFLEDSPMRRTSAPLGEGDRLGAYRILRPIGSGGMGDVYLAERADGSFERHVAIKVIRAGVALGEILERFLSERRLLAELVHPSIARLLDGGNTPDSRPYLVMEYVEGQPIDEYCDARSLPVQERLEIFLKVCFAVQHAHRHLVVHRDLKPANILVTSDGEPKLLDFGVAKDLGVVGKTPETRLLVPVTAEYASPEQLTGKPTSTAVDVYALGVVLYELLTGQNPFGDSRDPLSGRSETAPPSRPSSQVRNLRGPGARRLRRRLTGDLDHIVLRALEPDPAKRFTSVERFAAELDRHLRGQALETREGRLYRLGKLARRQWKALVATTALLGLAALGIGEALERRQLERETQRVGRLSEDLGSYIEDLFAETDPARSGERNETLEKILERGAELLASETLAGEPLMRARLLGAIGQVYRRRDLAVEAEPLLRECLTLRRRQLPPGDEWIAVAGNNLATALRALGRYSEARALLLETGEILRRHHPPDHPQIAKQLNNLAGVEKQLGLFDEGIEHYREALEMKRRLSLPPEVIAKAIKNLGVGLLAAGQLDEAEATLRQARDELSRSEQPETLTHAGLDHHLGVIRRQRSEFAIARDLLERAHATRIRLYDENHNKPVETLFELALLDRLDGRLEHADEKLRLVLEVRRRRLGGEHPQTAAVLLPLARLLAEGGDVKSAHAMAGEAIEIFRRRLPEDHWLIAEAEVLLNELSQSLAPSANGSARGVVVEEVGEGSALAKAGIEPGDVLLSWRRSPSKTANREVARGEIESAYDWMWLVVEQAPRGVVVITGRRGNEERVFTVALGSWQGRVRPWMSQSVLAAYLAGTGRDESEEGTQDGDWWARAATAATAAPLRSWIWWRLGQWWEEKREWENADAAYLLALENGGGRPFPESVIRRSIGKAKEEQNDFESARNAYAAAIQLRNKMHDGRSLGLAQMLIDLGTVAWRQGKLEESGDYFQRSLEIRQELAPNSLELAGSLNDLGVITENRGDLIEADVLHHRALAIRTEIFPDSLEIAESLNNLGIVADKRGELSKAADFHQQALNIRQRHSPEGRGVAISMNNLAVIASKRGDFAGSLDFHQRSLQLMRKISPGSLEVANSLNNIGVVTEKKGDLEQASEFYSRALKIREKLAPGSIDVANSLISLGGISRHRGDLASAADFYLRTLAILEVKAPDSLGLAHCFNRLGVIASRRQDFDRAEDYHRRALAIREKRAPESVDVAESIFNLSIVVGKRGSLVEMKSLLHRSLEIRKRKAPGSLLVADSLNALGVISNDTGDLLEAKNYHQRALTIRRSKAPGGLVVASSLHNLGGLAVDNSELDVAQEFFRQALDIRRRLSPHDSQVAGTLHALGRVHLNARPPREGLAEEVMLQSLMALENQVKFLGGGHDVRGAFAAQFHRFYRETMEVQIRLGKSAAAFHTLERSRARIFLEHLAERDVAFTSDIPADLDRKRRRLAVRFDRTQRMLWAINSDESERDSLRMQLRRLRDEARDVEEEIRRTSPELARLQYPRPLDLEAARAALDPGTLLLSYSIGEESVVVFVVAKEHVLQVKTLPITKQQLYNEVDDLVRQLRMARVPGSQRMRRFEERARRLYRILIEPIASNVAASQRLLILGDGPLHYLPWTALIRDTPDGGQYLLEWKPIHQALSATVFAELKKLRRKGGERPPPVRVAAFGDPTYPGNGVAKGRHGDPVVRSAAELCSFDFDALPYTRYEIDNVARFFPANQVRTYLGDQATEERVKALGRDVRIVHIAAHGCMDERFPLNSFVALSVPEEYQEGRDNGLLQAWEIFESVRLDADLVVLSACETALGKERGGEGLYGLTRAFQYAGARTVTASLWKVSDRATAELMSRFYEHLQQGEAKDQALRLAQMELLKNPIRVPGEDGIDQELDASAPYYWAAFQNYGDWQ